MNVAQTILAQLGGNRFIAMTGAKNLLSRPDGLQFKIGKNTKKVTHVRITLTAADNYTVEFLNVPSLRTASLEKIATMSLEETVLNKIEGVYADNLQEVFTSHTGLYTRL